MTLFKLFGIIDVRMADILDVLLISVILYYIFLLFRGTRAAQMIFGGFLLILAWLIAQWWELHTLVWMLSNLATLGIIAIVILFQPEIRSALTRIGQSVSKVDLRNILFHASGLDDMFGKRLDSGLSLQVEAFEDVSGVHISRLECRGRHLSRVQALAFNGKGLLQCLLFHFQLLVFFFRSLMSLYISPRRVK